jgi:cysteine-rich repeat protein
VDSGEQCDGGNTANFDGCASNCVWEIGNENRCNSDLRRALVANYTNLFPAGCTNTNCTEVRHVFRRDDLSGTTDTFLTLLGLPQATGRTFCNGLELEDLDPIRRKCDSTEQVCATIPYANRNANANGGTATVAATDPAVSGGDLGLVQAITMPADTTKQYSASACGLGRFGFVPMPTAIAAISQKCPDGNSRSGNLCRAPLTNTSKYGCLAVQGTRPANRVFVNMDGRGYNLMARDPDTGGLLSTLAGITDPRWGGGGVYRIHQTVSQAKAPAGWLCKETDATLQIGCLVIASPCSVSYAGREALFAGLDLVKAFVLRSPSNTADVPLLDENIRRLLDPVGASGGACVQGNGNNFGLRYALSRRLWINTEKGFGLPDFSNISDVVNGTVQTKEKMLAKCMADRTITDQAIVENNFTTITDRNCSAGVCDPNELDLDYRSRSCTPRCGDGIRQSNEGCDDGNVVSGDGCSATCVIEP